MDRGAARAEQGEGVCALLTVRAVACAAWVCVVLAWSLTLNPKTKKTLYSVLCTRARAEDVLHIENTGQYSSKSNTTYGSIVSHSARDWGGTHRPLTCASDTALVTRSLRGRLRALCLRPRLPRLRSQFFPDEVAAKLAKVLGEFVVFFESVKCAPPDARARTTPAAEKVYW